MIDWKLLGIACAAYATVVLLAWAIVGIIT